MGEKIRYPFVMKYEKFECYFRVYQPNANGDINIILRLNTVNDKATYRWVYGNISDYSKDKERFFKSLEDLIEELHDLEFAWEWEGSQNAKEYIICSVLYYVPVYNGGPSKINSKTICREEHPTGPTLVCKRIME